MPDEEEMERLIELLDVSSLAKELGIRRETVERYITLLERLFLNRRISAWRRSDAKRLIKSPKIYLLDSGLASTLISLHREDWQSHTTEFVALLESFVVQQLICQAGWVDSELRFSHYRDKNQVEVDLVIEQGRNIWGVELARLAAQAGKSFQGGILLYSGSHCLPLPQRNCYAVPMNTLWQ